MLEVPLTGEYHGDTLLVGLPDRILVADRTAGLHDRRHAVLGGQRHAVVEGEETVRRQHETFLKMIKGEATDADIEKLEEAGALQDISHMPARVKCAVLGWHTMEKLLDHKDEQ